MSDFELLESACDMVANSIDEHVEKYNEGVSLVRLHIMIDDAIGKLDFALEDFLEMFGNIYLCTPHLYAKNTHEDALWAQEHPEE